MKNLMVGDKVTIYEDPLTETKPEGEATIKKLLSHQGTFNDRTVWRCKVKFEGESQHYERKILAGE